MKIRFLCLGGQGVRSGLFEGDFAFMFFLSFAFFGCCKSDFFWASIASRVLNTLGRPELGFFMGSRTPFQQPPAPSTQHPPARENLQAARHQSAVVYFSMEWLLTTRKSDRRQHVTTEVESRRKRYQTKYSVLLKRVAIRKDKIKQSTSRRWKMWLDARCADIHIVRKSKLGNTSGKTKRGATKIDWVEPSAGSHLSGAFHTWWRSRNSKKDMAREEVSLGLEVKPCPDPFHPRYLKRPWLPPSSQGRNLRILRERKTYTKNLQDFQISTAAAENEMSLPLLPPLGLDFSQKRRSAAQSSRSARSSR